MSGSCLSTERPTWPRLPLSACASSSSSPSGPTATLIERFRVPPPPLPASSATTTLPFPLALPGALPPFTGGCSAAPSPPPPPRISAQGFLSLSFDDALGDDGRNSCPTGSGAAAVLALGVRRSLKGSLASWRCAAVRAGDEEEAAGPNGRSEASEGELERRGRAAEEESLFSKSPAEPSVWARCRCGACDICEYRRSPASVAWQR